jgi:hypothetical protein
VTNKEHARRRTAFLDAARGLSNHIVGVVMGSYGTNGIDWNRSTRASMVEAYIHGEAYGSKVREDVIAKLKAAPRGVGMGDVKHVLRGGKLEPKPKPVPPLTTRRKPKGRAAELLKHVDAIVELRSDVAIDLAGLAGKARAQLTLALLALDEARVRVQLTALEL